MAHPQYNQYQQQLHSLPPVQTQAHPQQNQAPQYQHSPPAMSPTIAGIPPAKRQRLSPNPPSPYQSPFSASPYAATSPYASSPPGNQYLSLPQSPATTQSSHSFHQPQPYQPPNAMDGRPPQGSMPPPKVPASRVQDNDELEKANPRDTDPNAISDVLTGSGIDLRAEEDFLMHSGRGSAYGNSFNSQASASTVSPHGSFNNWSQAGTHGAFQGTGPLSQTMSHEQQNTELVRKHEQAARVLNESAQQPLSDPFLLANVLRHRVARRAYEQGIQVNLEGLFDKIPENNPQNVTRTTITGANGESIVAMQADSLLNQNAPFVEFLALLSLAAEDRVRTILEDSFRLSQNRQYSSHGIVPPDLAPIADVPEDAQRTSAVPTNISKTAWEAPDSAISPMTVTATKQPVTGGRLPTPPTEPPPTPQPTVQLPNAVALVLRRKVEEDQKYEELRIARRQKRLKGDSATPSDIPTIAPLLPPEKMTKKERDRLNKMGQTEDVLHRKANETASMALGGKKKYAWMTGGGGGGSGASTPRVSTAVGPASGTATPAAESRLDRALVAKKRNFGANLENSEIGERIQVRDLMQVLDDDGKDRKTLAWIRARLPNSEKDERRRSTAPPPR